MTYELGLNDRPFKAIRSGIKKVEGRTPTDWDNTRYDQMVAGDIIIFTNNITNEKISCQVLFVKKYSDVRLMLETEGATNVLSSGLNIEDGIKSYNGLEGYEGGIKKFGIYAIGIRML